MLLGYGFISKGIENFKYYCLFTLYMAYNLMKGFIVFAICFSIIPLACSATEVYFFWGDGCPHCTAQKPYVLEWQQKFPNVTFHILEVWHNQSNLQIFKEVANRYGIKPSGVPTTFIGDKYWVGFKTDFLSEMEECLASGCKKASSTTTTTVLQERKTPNYLIYLVPILIFVVGIASGLFIIFPWRNKKKKKKGKKGDKNAENN